MITRWGMGTLGLAAFQADEEQSFLGYELTQGWDYSEATAARSMRMCERCLKNARSLFDSSQMDTTKFQNLATPSGPSSSG